MAQGTPRFRRKGCLWAGAGGGRVSRPQESLRVWGSRWSPGARAVRGTQQGAAQGASRPHFLRESGLSPWEAGWPGTVSSELAHCPICNPHLILGVRVSAHSDLVSLLPMARPHAQRACPTQRLLSRPSRFVSSRIFVGAAGPQGSALLRRRACQPRCCFREMLPKVSSESGRTTSGGLCASGARPGPLAIGSHSLFPSWGGRA